MERLSEAWDREADAWVAWARRAGHDSYWRFHREAFLGLLPAPGRIALDLGCGEGRVARDMASLGHRVLAVDRSPTMVRHAVAAGGPALVLQADSAALPLATASVDLVVAFMSLQDMDDMPGAVREAGRVLAAGGRLCLAVVHPLNAVGHFTAREVDAPFVVEGDYFQRRRFVDVVERDGLRMAFNQGHWPLQDYFGALEAAGLLTEAVREPRPGGESRWNRVPLFLHVRAFKQ